VAGEGDLLAQLDRLRRALDAEGLFAPQKRLARRPLPRCIGVVTGEGGKARDDVLAGLRRRGWAGRLVWAFAPVQDRHAAPAVTRALQDLAACEEVDVVIVARGGGSLADLFAFCDETLCRTVAMLRVPVIASVGHHTDRTLIDDVAAVSCSTPTHAAEAAVPVDCAAARAQLHGLAARLERQGRRAIVERARTLARLSRAPADHVARHRTRLHQHLRELRASARRGLLAEERHVGTSALVLERKAAATALGLPRGATRAHADAAALERSRAAAQARRAQTLERLRLALDAHDPQRTLERGYALVEGPAGEPVTSADAARGQPRLTLRMADGTLPVRPERAP
jgi:exodeoxyribonuclease VII large subunit